MSRKRQPKSPIEDILGGLNIKWDVVGGVKKGHVVTEPPTRDTTPDADRAPHQERSGADDPRWGLAFAAWVESWALGLYYWAIRAGAVLGWFILVCWLIGRACH
jgi:hypothetical protein